MSYIYIYHVSQSACDRRVGGGDGDPSACPMSPVVCPRVSSCVSSSSRAPNVLVTAAVVFLISIFVSIFFSVFAVVERSKKSARPAIEHRTAYKAYAIPAVLFRRPTVQVHKCWRCTRAQTHTRTHVASVIHCVFIIFVIVIIIVLSSCYLVSVYIYKMYIIYRNKIIIYTHRVIYLITIEKFCGKYTFCGFNWLFFLCFLCFCVFLFSISMYNTLYCVYDVYARSRTIQSRLGGNVKSSSLAAASLAIVIISYNISYTHVHVRFSTALTAYGPSVRVIYYVYS